LAQHLDDDIDTDSLADVQAIAAFSESSLGFLLHDVARLSRRNMDRRIRPLGLTQTQWRVLIRLSITPGLRQIELADLMELQPISVARLIDRMESAGLVKRHPAPSDRRAFNLHLTEKAQPMLQKLQSYAEETSAQALKNISLEDRKHFFETLAKIRLNIKEE